MRKVTASLFISLDGVVQAPNEWQFAFDEQMAAAVTRTFQDADTVLLGRVTYQEWADYWPTSDDEPFASWINNTPKFVASTTLDSVDAWPNSTLIKGPVTDFVAHLRQQKGKTITTGGSPTLVRTLLGHHLLDELTLMIHPVIAGETRKHLFPEDCPLTTLTLTHTQQTTSGVIITTYQPTH